MHINNWMMVWPYNEGFLSLIYSLLLDSLWFLPVIPLDEWMQLRKTEWSKRKNTKDWVPSMYDGWFYSKIYMHGWSSALSRRVSASWGSRCYKKNALSHTSNGHVSTLEHVYSVRENREKVENMDGFSGWGAGQIKVYRATVVLFRALLVQFVIRTDKLVN